MLPILPDENLESPQLELVPKAEEEGAIKGANASAAKENATTVFPPTPPDTFSKSSISNSSFSPENSISSFTNISSSGVKSN